mmetsp:Transcript_12480/g.34378  ORF Transcript_12480/g.34378 Transcript_12480/m.34378 type:complete len:108 (+) Transcript_12480:324-647(+)
MSSRRRRDSHFFANFDVVTNFMMAICNYLCKHTRRAFTSCSFLCGLVLYKEGMFSYTAQQSIGCTGMDSGLDWTEHRNKAREAYYRSYFCYIRYARSATYILILGIH